MLSLTVPYQVSLLSRTVDGTKWWMNAGLCVLQSTTEWCTCFFCSQKNTKSPPQSILDLNWMFESCPDMIYRKQLLYPAEYKSFYHKKDLNCPYCCFYVLLLSLDYGNLNKRSNFFFNFFKDINKPSCWGNPRHKKKKKRVGKSRAQAENNLALLFWNHVAWRKSQAEEDGMISPWSQRGKKRWTYSHIFCDWGEIASSLWWRKTHTHTNTHMVAFCLAAHFCTFSSHFSPRSAPTPSFPDYS